MRPEEISALGPTGPEAIPEAFTNSETHPLVLGLILLKTFKTEYLGWEPETVWAEIYLSFGRTPSAASRNKIQAIRSSMVASAPYEAWDIFENVALGLRGLPPRFDMVQQANPLQCAFALDVLSSLRQDVKVSKEVYKYVAAGMFSAGYVYGPGPLEPCNDYVQKLGEGSTSSMQDAVRLLVANNSPGVAARSPIGLQAAKSQAIVAFVRKQNALFIEQSSRLLS